MRRNQPLEPMVEVVSFTATLRSRLSGIALHGAALRFAESS